MKRFIVLAALLALLAGLPMVTGCFDMTMKSDTGGNTQDTTTNPPPATESESSG